MNEAEKNAIACLAGTGQLTDPKYRSDPHRYEELLKAQVKACWGHRESFPGWVKAYVKKWSVVK